METSKSSENYDYPLSSNVKLLAILDEAKKADWKSCVVPLVINANFVQICTATF